MDNEFQTTKKPSQWIYSNIIAGSTISLTDLDGLRTFARSCESAKGLMESSPNTFLSLNEQMTQECIFQRLSPEMSREWFRYRRDKGIPKGAVRLAIFADWIKDQASIELERIGSDRRESLSSTSSTTQKEKTEPASSRTAYQPPHNQTAGMGYVRNVDQDDPSL